MAVPRNFSRWSKFIEVRRECPSREELAVEILNCYHAASLVLAGGESKRGAKENFRRAWRKVRVGF